MTLAHVLLVAFVLLLAALVVLVVRGLVVSEVQIAHVYNTGDRTDHLTDGRTCWCDPDVTPDGIVMHRRIQ